MTKLEAFLARFLIACAVLLLLVGGTVSWVLYLEPGFYQSQYSAQNKGDIRLNALSAQFTRDCRELAKTTDPLAQATLQAGLAQAAAPPIDITTMGMPPETRQCVINAMHEARK